MRASRSRLGDGVWSELRFDDLDVLEGFVDDWTDDVGFGFGATLVKLLVVVLRCGWEEGKGVCRGCGEEARGELGAG